MEKSKYDKYIIKKDTVDDISRKVDKINWRRYSQ